MDIVYFLVVVLASTIGTISGIGGGVIIKPVLDSLGTMGVPAISFLSGCTVLAMSSVSLMRNLGKGTIIRLEISIFLAGGAVFGGIAGKSAFQYFLSLFATGGASLAEGDAANRVGLVQAFMLLAINLGVYAYMIFKARIRTKEMRNPVAGLATGLGLGLLSSFLGIGGGPINIAVLYYFYSMRPKETALNSLFVIFCSQLASLVTSLATRTVPEISMLSLVVMCSGGVAGSLLGNRISSRISEHAVERFFKGVLGLLIAINLWNIVRFATL